MANLHLSVNCSRKQLADAALVGTIAETLAALNLSPLCPNLEITESTIMEQQAGAQEIQRRLKQLGIQLHMDDFGARYSSLSCLHAMPLDTLKIDRSFGADVTCGSIQWRVDVVRDW